MQKKLNAILVEDGFNDIWKAHKDMTKICSDCEFRYMCFDNRIPHRESEVWWANEQSCNYNPYLSFWQGEEGYIDTNEYFKKNVVQ